MNTDYLSLHRIIQGNLLSVIEQVLHIGKTTVDTSHTGYTLIHTPRALNFRTASAIGVYKDTNNRMYVIKDFAYTLHNIDYQYLHNEIETLTILHSGQPSRMRVRVPRLVEGTDRNHRIRIITTFETGDTLDHFPSGVQTQIVIRTLTYLREMQHNRAFSVLSKRTQMLTFITFLMYCIRAYIKEASARIFLFRAYGQYLRYLPAWITQKPVYRLNHRDLSVDNVLYDKKQDIATILDTECMVVGDSLYDLALVPRLYNRHLSSDEIISVFTHFRLDRNEKIRLIVLMIAACVIKIATEQKGSRDYKDAVGGLRSVVTTYVPFLASSV
jgi:hypothetical protein